jgi:hypothetical protein
VSLVFISQQSVHLDYLKSFSTAENTFGCTGRLNSSVWVGLPDDAAFKHAPMNVVGEGRKVSELFCKMSGKRVRVFVLLLLEPDIPGMLHHPGFKVLLGVPNVDFTCHFALHLVDYQFVSADTVVFAGVSWGGPRFAIL